MPKKTELTPTHWQAIPRAWQIAWEHKHLWLFGFFAASVGYGGVFEMLANAYDRLTNVMPSLSWIKWPYFLLPGGSTLKAVLTFSPNPALSLAIFLTGSALAAAVLIWLMVVALGAIIGSANKISGGSDADFSEGVRFGTEKFWRLFSINVMAKIIIGLMIVLTGINLFSFVEGSLVSSLFFGLSFVIFTILAAIVAVVAVYATNEAVLGGKELGPALASGWKMFRNHWLTSLEFALMLMIINLGVTVAVILGLVILATPFFFLFVVAAVAGLAALVANMSAFAVAAVLFIIMIAASFMTTFQIAAWTLVWKELSASKTEPGLVRFLNKVFCRGK